MKKHPLIVFAASVFLLACSEEVGDTGGSGGQSPSGTTTATGGGIPIDEGASLRVDVSADGMTLVDLSEPAVLDSSDTSTPGWDIAFSGYDIFTNSGVSGPGAGGAFGPLSPPVFLSDVEPEVPFVLEDRTGGAFLRWYAYEGTSHALWSRYHVYGVKDQNDFYKVQVLSYYGEIQGAPVSGIYRLRWAKVDADGVGPVTDIDDLDGTAGGLSGGPDDPSGCLDLATGKRLSLTAPEALNSSEWHLCFRRDTISVNGESGGPRGVGAVDLTRRTEGEEVPLEEAKTLTAETAMPAFEAIGFDELSDPKVVYRGDRIVSAFGSYWYDAGSPPTPSDAVWLVRGSDGSEGFLLFVEEFADAVSETPTTVTIRVKKVSG